MTDVTVSMVDMRRALAALRPHLPDPKEDHLGHLGRIHCQIEPWGLLAMATNTVTAGLAMVDVLDSADGEVGTTLDLSPDEAKEILGLFRPAKAAGDDDPDSALRLQTGEGSVVVTDVTGLFPGRAATFPRMDLDLGEYPNLPGTFGVVLAIAASPALELVTYGPVLAAFAAAARAYKAPLLLRPQDAVRPRLLVECGDAFVGILTAPRLDVTREAELDTWRDGWRTRLRDRVGVSDLFDDLEED